MDEKSVVEALGQLKFENDIKMVQIMGTDIDGKLRGKLVDLKKLSKDGSLNPLNFCSVVFEWDIEDLCYPKKEGETYPDFICKVDPATFRPSLPWFPNYPTMLVDFYNKQDMQPLTFCPRNLLKSVLSRYEAKGFSVSVGVELEWYNYKETPTTLREKGFQHLNPLTEGMTGYAVDRFGMQPEYTSQLLKGWKALNIPIECFHCETGPGVYEVALSPMAPLKASDSLQLFKWATKLIGHSLGITPSFMAKPSSSLPGCGCHLHFSVWQNGKNLFADENVSETLRWFMGGVLQCLPDVMPMVAPNVNSYKRYDAAHWAPVKLTWGTDDRMAALRCLLDGEPSSHRVECRVGGSDLNPYLAMSAILAAGLYGIEHKIEPSQDSSNVQCVPMTLTEAVSRMKAPESLSRKLFSNAFVDRFVFTREIELDRFNRAVTDWERTRYLD